MSGPARYLVVALGRRLSEKVTDHLRDLQDAGVPVRLVLVDEAAVTALRDSGALPERDPARHLLEVDALLPAERHRLLDRIPNRPRRPLMAALRPWLLSRRWRSVARRLDAAPPQHIIAGDLHAISLVRRLANHYPGVVATTALDRPSEPAGAD